MNHTNLTTRELAEHRHIPTPVEEDLDKMDNRLRQSEQNAQRLSGQIDRGSDTKRTSG